MKKILANYQHFLAEFVVVVLGVALALAADEWRKDAITAVEETEYLSRLKEDLLLGSEQIDFNLERFSNLQHASASIMNYYDEHDEPMNQEVLFTSIMESARLGSSDADFNHDTTYLELLSSGRLNLISNSELRTRIQDYYRDILALDNAREVIDRSLTYRIRALTGYRPLQLLRDPGILTEAGKQRVFTEFLEHPEMLENIRLSHSQADLLIARLEYTEIQNRELLDALDNE